MHQCKLCDLLRTLPRDEALEANELLLSEAIKASRFTAVTVKRVGEVGVTTVKKHRKERHREF